MTAATKLPDPATRLLITVSVMAASFMNTLDSTIANVALPHIQGSVGASREQITWVLTSYIVAAAIMVPLTGWVAGRFGRKRLMLISILGFTVVSGLCGVATNLGELVGFRILQGVFGAALMPMSQAILLDINPPEKHGQAMAVFTLGAVLAPVMGPVLGGWLTDNLSWRWVFYINLPVGLLAFAGVSASLTETRLAERVKLDLFGFATLGLAIGCLQLILDRGQGLDWFSSTEIRIEAAIAALCIYLFIVQLFTVRKPFIDVAIFADRNFVVCSLLGFLISVLSYGFLSVMPQMLQKLMGYPVVSAGFVMVPYGVSTMVSVLVVSRIGRFVDGRILIFLGLVCVALSTTILTHMSLQMNAVVPIMAGVAQGVGSGMVFVSISTYAFASLPARYRNEGTAMFTLIRNMGTSIGISAFQVLSYRNAQTVHSRLTEGLRADNPSVQGMSSAFSLTDPSGVAALAGEVERQSQMVAYIDGFWLLHIVALLSMAMVLLIRPARSGVVAGPVLVE